MHSTYVIKVELSADWWIHNMFYIKKFSQHLKKSDIQSEIKSESLIKIDNYNEWEVNTILNYIIIKQQWKYLIK